MDTQPVRDGLLKVGVIVDTGERNPRNRQVMILLKSRSRFDCDTRLADTTGSGDCQESRLVAGKQFDN